MMSYCYKKLNHTTPPPLPTHTHTNRFTKTHIQKNSKLRGHDDIYPAGFESIHGPLTTMYILFFLYVSATGFYIESLSVTL